MPDLSRRGFLGAAVAVTGAAVVGATASPAADALSALARGHGRHGDIRDIAHVVIVMQENRSFRPLLRIAARGARLR
ncbi:MAG TPA: twin-arginine translocation signal domain-containing protein [Pseudonocardiaceae bacterium]|nr:twin-arginine translocation signal domain-containing protein [Pseudonocardiaceae bacterium]